MSKSEVMSWRPFWFLHTYINCVMYNSSVHKGIFFFWTDKKTSMFSGFIRIIPVSIQFSEWDMIPDSVNLPFPLLVCEGSTDFHWKLKGQAASRFGRNLPLAPQRAYSVRKPFHFQVCTLKCRRQRKQATDGKEKNRKINSIQTGSDGTTCLYAVYRFSCGRIFRIIIKRADGKLRSLQKKDLVYPPPFIRLASLYPCRSTSSISLLLYKTFPPST